MTRDDFGRDRELFNSLPVAEPGEVEVYLSWNEGDNVKQWRFLYPIQELTYRCSIKYETAGTVTDTQELYWIGNEPETIILPNLLLNTYWDRKSIKPILDGITALKNAGNQRNPPQMSFVCGNLRLSPCVLIDDVGYTITQFLGNEPVEALISLTLAKVDRGQIVIPSLPSALTEPLILLPSLVIPAPAPTPTPPPGVAPTNPVNPVPLAPGFATEIAKYVYKAGGCTCFAVANDGSDGVIATAGHCVGGGGIKVTIDGKSYNCPTIDSSATDVLDVAIVRVPGYKFDKVLQLGDSSTAPPGTEVYSIGYPGMDEPQETTYGTVRSNPLKDGESQFHEGTSGAYILYSNRFLFPGNSGGPQFKKSDNTVISTTAGGAPMKNAPTGGAKTKDNIEFNVPDNEPTGSKVENLKGLMEKAGIKNAP